MGRQAGIIPPNGRRGNARREAPLPSALCALQGVTPTCAVALRPSTLAEIPALPGTWAVTVPSDATLATDSLSLVQVNVLPATTAPPASSAVAVNRAVLPA